MHTRSSFAFVAALALTALATVGACSNQGEGQVCDASSDDCQPGLLCQPQGALGYRCCPVAPAQPTTQICSPNHPGVSDANVPPEEGGGGSEAGPDASSQPDQSTAEASSDAPADTSPGADASEAAATGAEASDGPTE